MYAEYDTFNVSPKQKYNFNEILDDKSFSDLEFNHLKFKKNIYNYGDFSDGTISQSTSRAEFYPGSQKSRSDSTILVVDTIIPIYQDEDDDDKSADFYDLSYKRIHNNQRFGHNRVMKNAPKIEKYFSPNALLDSLISSRSSRI